MTNTRLAELPITDACGVMHYSAFTICDSLSRAVVCTEHAKKITPTYKYIIKCLERTGDNEITVHYLTYTQPLSLSHTRL